MASIALIEESSSAPGKITPKSRLKRPRRAHKNRIAISPRKLAANRQNSTLQKGVTTTYLT